MSRQKHPFSKQIIDPVRQYATKERKLRPHPRPFAGNFSAVFPTKSGVLQLLLRAQQIRRGRGRRICGRGPQDDGTRPPDGRTVGPTISFLERDGAAWRYQRKIVGGFDAFCSSGSQKAPPTPPPGLRKALSPSQNPPSKKKGFTGEHGSPVKSRAARGAVPHCISAEMPRLSPWRVLSWTAPAARSLCSPPVSYTHLTLPTT